MKFTVTPVFALILASVLFLTLLSGGFSVWLAAQANLSDLQLALFDKCTAICEMGAGSIFVLLGSKATELLK